MANYSGITIRPARVLLLAVQLAKVGEDIGPLQLGDEAEALVDLLVLRVLTRPSRCPETVRRKLRGG